MTIAIEGMVRTYKLRLIPLFDLEVSKASRDLVQQTIRALTLSHSVMKDINISKSYEPNYNAQNTFPGIKLP